MLEVTGNIWEQFKTGGWLLLEISTGPSNGRFIVNNELSNKVEKEYPDVYSGISNGVTKSKGRVFAFTTAKILAFPTRQQFDVFDLGTLQSAIVDVIKLQKSINELNSKKKTKELEKIYLPKLGKNEEEWNVIKTLIDILDDQFVLVKGVQVPETKKEVNKSYMSPLEVVDDNIVPSFKCPACGVLIEIVENSGEYFAIYGSIALGESGKLLDSAAPIDRLGRPKPIRMCCKCLPKFLTDRATKQKAE